MPQKTGRFVMGVILVLLGVIFLLPNLSLPFNWGNIWPFFIILGGLAFILGWTRTPEHDPGLAFVGTGGLLVGLFMGLFAWGILPWEAMGSWWPAFPLIGGLAFLVLWAADRREDPGILIPALAGILTGTVAFVFTSNLLGVGLISKWWPVLIIVLGGVVLIGQMGATEKK